MATHKASAQLKAARRHLSDEQLIAFLRAANTGRPHSVGLAIRALDAGSSLEDLFRFEVPPEWKQYRMTTELKVQPIADHTYKITFGHHGPQYGDGGEWEVEYTPDGNVKRLVPQTYWIH